MWWSGQPLQSHSIAADWLALLLSLSLLSCYSASKRCSGHSLSLTLASIALWIKCLPRFSKTKWWKTSSVIGGAIFIERRRRRSGEEAQTRFITVPNDCLAILICYWNYQECWNDQKVEKWLNSKQSNLNPGRETAQSHCQHTNN